MTDFLLELRSEEIPARMQAGARADLEKLFRREMETAGVTIGNVTVWSTPRRLALIARDLPQATSPVREEIKGPRTTAPDKALEGFLRKVGLEKDRLEDRGGIWFAVVEKPGRAVRDVLAEAIPAIVRAFPWPKSMRWGRASLATDSLRWVRPLSGIVAIFGEDLVECEVGGVQSSYATRGHRFHHHHDITIGGAHDYADKLRACHVIVDHEGREALIRDGAAEAARAAGLALVEDEGLVIENAGLTEWPVPLLGRFDREFLEVPPEVVQLTARTNQKYFVCEQNGKLTNAFVCTANIQAEDRGAAIVAGNRKVLAARLADARFFWDQDRKKTLKEHAKELERITFHEKLGTVADKVERVAKLARWLVEEGIVKPSPTSPSQQAGKASYPLPQAGEERDLTSIRESSRSGEGGITTAELANLAEQAARLCKADLVTEMVGEFPELQGVIGGYYARAEGLPDEVADAIRDHYKPVGQVDQVPTAPVTVAVSLADKLDTLVGFFMMAEFPTGSKDPYALRRAAIGIIRLIRSGARGSMAKIVARTAEPIICDWLVKVPDYLEYTLIYTRNFEWNDAKVAEARDIAKHTQGALAYFRTTVLLGLAEIPGFFADRLKVQQREAGVRHDLIDAVFALGGEDDLVRLLARVHALQNFIDTDDGANLLVAYKRAANILKKEDWRGIKGEKALSYIPEPEEKALMEALDTAGPEATAAVEGENFGGAMAALARLRAPIDAFFDHVTVNDPDQDKRLARLALLDRFRTAVHNVADFSKIEG